jgi:hypothetical protein
MQLNISVLRKYKNKCIKVPAGVAELMEGAQNRYVTIYEFDLSSQHRWLVKARTNGMVINCKSHFRPM